MYVVLHTTALANHPVCNLMTRAQSVSLLLLPPLSWKHSPFFFFFSPDRKLILQHCGRRIRVREQSRFLLIKRKHQQKFFFASNVEFFVQLGIWDWGRRKVPDLPQLLREQKKKKSPSVWLFQASCLAYSRMSGWNGRMLQKIFCGPTIRSIFWLLLLLAQNFQFKWLQIVGSLLPPTPSGGGPHLAPRGGGGEAIFGLLPTLSYQWGGRGGEKETHTALATNWKPPPSSPSSNSFFFTARSPITFCFFTKKSILPTRSALSLSIPSPSLLPMGETERPLSVFLMSGGALFFHPTHPLGRPTCVS